MEASMAAAQQGDGQGQGEGGEAQGQQGPDVAALAEQLAEMGTSQEELRALLTANQLGVGDHTWPAADHEQLDGLDFDGDELDALGLDDAGIDPGEQFDPEAQAQALDAFVSDRIQQAVAPLAQEMEQRWLAGEYRDLANEFPELGEEGVLGEVLHVARTVAEAEGWPASMASSPGMVRMAYLATKAIEAANAESQEEPPDAAHLEGGGGAGPAGGRGLTAGQSIVDAGRQSVLPFP
jgi:hypothetical protein